MVIPINEVILNSAVGDILPEVTDTVYNIDTAPLDHSMFPFDISFFFLIDQIEATKFVVSKEGRVSSNTILSIPDRQIILILQ